MEDPRINQNRRMVGEFAVNWLSVNRTLPELSQRHKVRVLVPTSTSLNLACAERRKRHHLVALDSTQMKHRNFTKLMSHGILSWNLHFNSSSVNSIVTQIELQSEARALPNSTFTRQTGTYKKKREERKKQKR